MKRLITILIAVVIFTFALCFSASAAKISAPKSVKATTTSSSVTLKWSKVKGADYYRVYYRTSTKSKWKTAVKNTSATSKTFEKLPSGKKYYFAVRSFDKNEKNTGYSEMKKLNTATKPLQTKKLTATPTVKTVKLSWSEVEGATHYRVYQKVGNDWKSLGLTTKTAKTVKNLKSDTSYTFAVRAYVKTKTINVFGSIKSVKATTKRAPNDNYVAKTDGGIKLYPVATSQAKAIFEKWGDPFNTFYEGKNAANKTVIFVKSSVGWIGIDLNGAEYDAYGNIRYCQYCGKPSGRGDSMCNGCLEIGF